MHIVIIGAGWYGLTLSSFLVSNGLPQGTCISIIDQSPSIMYNNASRFNQCRLHLGFHYPRSYDTRKLCRDSYDEYMEMFPELSYEIKDNWYVISKESIIDFKTFEAIYSHEEYEFEKVAINSYIQNVDEGIAVCVKERGIDPRKVIEYFNENLRGVEFYFNHKIELLDGVNNKIIGKKTNDEQFELMFDYCYDCSNLQVPINVFSEIKVTYEKTISLLYKRKSYEAEFGALTVMDGPFFSIFPYEPENEVYTVTHVKHSVLLLDEVNIEIIRSRMESDIQKYYPMFLSHFEYYDYFMSPKTKPVCHNDSRHLILEDLTDAITRVSCGKITGIFQMIDKIHLKS